MTPHLWVVSELYYPEDSATGYLLTKIAEALAQRFQVQVVCAQPPYQAHGTHAPAREMRRGVLIRRCWGTKFGKDIILLRLVNILTRSLSLFLTTLFSIQRYDQVLVVTNPPLLPFMVTAACHLRRARCLLLIHDVYPEVLVATHLAAADSPLVKGGGWLSRRLYRAMDAIIVLGRDMRQLVERRLGGPSERIVIIPNWADIQEVRPLPRQDNDLLRELNLLDKFVVQYAGNMGRTHGLETLLDCAERMHPETRVHFLFVGAGAKRIWLEENVRAKALTNVTILDRRPRSDLANLLNGCDVSVISFVPGMAGISVPSRMYNVLAAGKPIIAAADQASELAQLVEEEDVGWVVPPLSPERLAAAIRAAYTDPGALAAMGVRARQAATRKYTLERVIELYISLLTSLQK